MTTPRFPLTAAVLTPGAGAGNSSTGTGIPSTPDGPVAARHGALLERSDTWLFTGQQARRSLTAGGGTIAGTVVEAAASAGARNVTPDGTATTVQELATAFAGTAAEGGAASLGMRGGVGTATARANSRSQGVSPASRWPPRRRR